MNIPDEAMKRFPDEQADHAGRQEDRRLGFEAGAEWARKEALREAASVLRGEGEPGHAGEFLSVNHAQELIHDLAEGTQS